MKKLFAIQLLIKRFHICNLEEKEIGMMWMTSCTA